MWDFLKRFLGYPIHEASVPMDAPYKVEPPVVPVPPVEVAPPAAAPVKPKTPRKPRKPKAV